MAELVRLGNNSFIKGIDICYICNRKKCKHCSSALGLTECCTHTFDQEFAISTSGLFEYINTRGDNGVLWQYEVGK